MGGLEPYAISTSKKFNYFLKAPKNMKQLGLDASSISLSRKIHWKTLQEVLHPKIQFHECFMDLLP